MLLLHLSFSLAHRDTAIAMAPTEVLSALVTGSLAFWTFFHRGEHFLYSVRYIQLLTVTTLAGTIFLTSSTKITFKEASAASVRLVAIFLTGVYASCAVYRLFSNPLNKVPGPYFARLSKFNHVFQNKSFDAHHKLLRCTRSTANSFGSGPTISL